MTLLITEQEMLKLPMSIKAAVPVMEDSFRMAGRRTAENPPRFRMPFKNGFLQFGPAALHEKQIAGFKLWANFGRGSGVRKSHIGHGYDYLYSMETGELLAILHSAPIGKYRTGAVTAVAAKYLSQENASSIGIYGAGPIAAGQLEGVCAVRPIKTIRVYTRTPEKCAAFCRKMSAHLGVDVIPATTAGEVPRHADIVITATTSDVPVLFGDDLVRPQLVVAAGANHWHKREVDGKVIERANLIVTDEKEHSRVESGNLLWAVGHGLVTWDQVETLADVIVGRAVVPDLKSSTILFASHGLAITDVAIAVKAYELAKEAGMGTQIDL